MELTDLKGVKYQRKILLERLNVFSIGDLISLFPRKYKDFSKYNTLDQALFNENEEMLIRAKIIGFENIQTRNRKKILKVKIQDGSANAYLVAFNQPFLKNNLIPDQEYDIVGNFTFQYGEIQANNFQIVSLDKDSLHSGRIVPFYPLTQGLNQKWMRETIHQALSLVLAKAGENLPSNLIEKRELISRDEALFNIHFPESFEKLEQARKRLKYFELFKIEFQMALKKILFQKTKNRNYADLSLPQSLTESLPFDLTPGQKKAFEEIKQDLLSPNPMHRLLQGDVGAGKTLVSLLALLTAIGNGYQGVLMVPTEVLARQHYQKITKMLKPLGINTGLLISAVKGKRRISVLSRVQSGDIQLIIGTHSLFSEDVRYKKLAVAVIDEQHKFGVMQRASLIQKGENPDILIMTATPIPRTLGISVFGDMDISIIPDKPAGRKEIITQWKSEKDLEKVMEFADRQIEEGHQGYIVYPLIEDSEKLDLKSVTSMFETLNEKYFPHRRLTLLHGRMSEEEKEEAMFAFLHGEADILVSTTVIEVGVDVPRANFIIIENAHRFGLSTLHQLRGRVGRSDIQSYCFLITPSGISEEGKSRMMAMRESNDGFVLSRKDLEIRGIGDFLGTRQKGFKGLKLASLIHDVSLLEEAREDAFHIVRQDPRMKQPEHRVFMRWYEDFCKKYHTLLRT
jgi:ATP-dependent DNA helicase RecG